MRRPCSLALVLTVMFAAAPIAACRHASIPYDLTSVQPAPKPVHPLRVAVLPLEDARSAKDGPDEEAAEFEYQGLRFDHTRLDALDGSPLWRVTELVARHLATARVFAQVILVRSADQAPEADLLLTGKLRRLRGYVEADQPSKQSGRPADERMVLAEVLLGDLELRDAKHPEKILASVDAGASLYEPRTVRGEPPSPWDVLGEALHRAVSSLVTELEHDDLSGAFVLAAETTLDPAEVAPERSAAPFAALDETPPAGWALTKTSSASLPIGWKGAAPRCRTVELEQKQTLAFHRALGAYHPAVRVWSCPKALALVYDAREEFPAEYLGTRSDGARYFLHRVGESNWPRATDEVKRRLGVTPPAARYVFELPAE